MCASAAPVVVAGGSRMWRLEVVAIGLGGKCGFVSGRGRWVSARCCVLGALAAAALVVCAAPARAATSHTEGVSSSV